jgi:Tol biopolymer transport system component
MARALTSGNAFDEQPGVLPGRDALAFVSDRGGRRSIWTMSADGGIPERLVDADVVDRLVWSRDSRRIVFAVTKAIHRRSSRSAWLMAASNPCAHPAPP